MLNRFPHHTQQSTAHDGSTGRGDQPGINEQNTVRVMMYMFPRQFGLHNVFTSAVERPKTAQKFPDYTLREEEIANKFGKGGDAPSHILTRVPKRLRGSPTRLVERLQILHGRCSYSQLLRHHCPVCGVFLGRAKSQVWLTVFSGRTPSCGPQRDSRDQRQECVLVRRGPACQTKQAPSKDQGRSSQLRADQVF